MKSVLISIQPYWVFLIIAKTMGWSIGKEKTVEVRKTYPKDDNWNKAVKIYCSNDKKSFAKIPKEYQSLMRRFLGKVIGEFMCDEIDEVVSVDTPCVRYITVNDRMDMFFSDISCLDVDELGAYLGFNKKGYSWYISNLVIYDKPKKLSVFRKPCVNEVYCESCAMYNNFYDSCGNKALGLKRPPQSWCYVEALA